jgi:hypothetical protein
VPANQDASRGTHLEQLQAMWADAGRIDTGGPKRQKEILVLTSSANPAVKVAIQDPIHKDCHAGGCFRACLAHEARSVGNHANVHNYGIQMPGQITSAKP